jgi:hypothetical protein
MRLYINSLSQCNSSTMRKFLQADMQLISLSPECWSSHTLSAMEGLTQSFFTYSVRSNYYVTADYKSQLIYCGCGSYLQSTLKLVPWFVVTAVMLNQWLRLRTKKGLQGGKTIQQRSELASLCSLMLLPVLWLMPLRSLCIHVCVSTGATHLWLAPTLLLLPRTGTNDSDRPLGLIVVTH